MLDLWLPGRRALKHFHVGVAQGEILQPVALPVLLFYILTR